MSFAVNAVRTTGIYCRAECTARPLERNCQPFASGVAAEAAGYRPCLRCRPDRLPPLTDGDGVVGRGLSLIAQGVLDAGSEDALAQRLGLTGRHLRRIFHERIGATPSFVARSRRAHFARRLLDETDLRIVDVAYASGFASVRQMNRVMSSFFRFTPVELRAKRRDADRLVVDGGLPLRVPYAGPLAFPALLSHRAPRAIPGVEAIADGVYRRTISTAGNPGVIEVSDAGDGAHLVVVAHLPALVSLLDEVERCRRLFGLDRTPAAATPLARDRLLRPLVRRYAGLRTPGAWDPFETSVRIMLGQQVSVAGATTLAGRLVAAFGEPVAGLGSMRLTHTFPSPERIAGASMQRLRDIGLPGARAESIRAFARAGADGQLRIDAATPLDEIEGTLRAVPGVGPWTAQMIALVAAGQQDAFPAGDLGLRRAAARLTGASSPLRQQDLEILAEAWRPYRAIAAMLLWVSSLEG